MRRNLGGKDRTRNEQRGRKTLLRIVVILVTAVTVILYTAAVIKIRDSSRPYSISYRTTDYAHSVPFGRFGDMYDTAISDMAAGKTYSGEVAEYRALAFYYENAVLAHAYRAAGELSKAEEFEEKMASYEQEMGSLSGSAEKARAAAGW